jgi:hypothetical protein
MTDIDATEVFSQRPQGPSREQTLKRVQDKYPGHISWATDSANFSGCRVITFSPGAGFRGLEKEDAEQLRKELAEMYGSVPLAEVTAEDVMNLYFSKRANLLLVNVKPLMSGIQCIVTTQLDADDLAEFEEVQRRVQLDMREWRERRDKDKQAELEAAREERRLIEVGRKAETYNLFAKLRELEEEVSKLRKGLSDAAKS